MARTRQLAAIMFTNIDGYSSLMQQDEPKAIELKARHLEVFNRANKKFHGKILPYFGPHSLILFSSAVEAVKCAIEMQLAFRNNPVVPVRIGIHLGDIIYSDEEAIGDGVNIALKIESQAIPGSILISNKIYEEVKNQKDIQMHFIQSCCLDEIENAVDVYAISNDGMVIPGHQSTINELIPQNEVSRSKLLEFWEELKRRKVVKVVSIYAAAAYVILELTSIIEEALELPEFTTKVVIILLSIGFIIISILSWIYDFTPEGIRRTQALGLEGSMNPDGNYTSDSGKVMIQEEGRPWFFRNRIFTRYMIPFLLFATIFVILQFRERIFVPREKVNKEAQMHTERAKLYINNNADFQLIKQELDLALAEDPQYADALYTYALVHRVEGDTAAAKQKLLLAVDFDSTYSKAWDLLANLAFQEDSFELALDYSFQAVKNDPSNSTAAFNIAIQCEDRDFPGQALVWYRKAIDIDSTFTAAYSALGRLYNKMDRPIDAVLILQKSLSITSVSVHNFRVYKNLAEAHFLLKEYDKALGYLEQSKSLNPDFPEMEKCFARYFEVMGETDQSLQHWRRYLVLETDTVKLIEAQNHLDTLKIQGPS